MAEVRVCIKGELTYWIWIKAYFKSPNKSEDGQRSSILNHHQFTMRNSVGSHPPLLNNPYFAEQGWPNWAPFKPVGEISEWPGERCRWVHLSTSAEILSKTNIVRITVVGTRIGISSPFLIRIIWYISPRFMSLRQQEYNTLTASHSTTKRWLSAVMGLRIRYSKIRLQTLAWA